MSTKSDCVFAAVFFIIITGFSIGIIFLDEYQKDNNLIDKGTVSDKGKLNEVYGNILYWAEIDNMTAYEITEDSYYNIQKGDLIAIYENGRVKIIE